MPRPPPFDDDRFRRHEDGPPLPRMPGFEAPRRRSTSRDRFPRGRSRSPPAPGSRRPRSPSPLLDGNRIPNPVGPRAFGDRPAEHFAAQRHPSPPRKDPWPNGAGPRRVLSQFEDPSQREEPHTPNPTPPRRAGPDGDFKPAGDPLDYLRDPLLPRPATASVRESPPRPSIPPSEYVPPPRRLEDTFAPVHVPPPSLPEPPRSWPGGCGPPPGIPARSQLCH